MNTQKIDRANSIRCFPLRRGFIFGALGLVLIALSPQARAVCQDGCDVSNLNTFLGDNGLINNTTGEGNTAVGGGALTFNTTGVENTANGVSALASNTTGDYNTASGGQALSANTTGDYNTASGYLALWANTTGDGNAASGVTALYLNTTGSYNTATGVTALYFNTSGSNNIAVGYGAGMALTTGSNNIDVGNTGVADESNTIRIGTQGTQIATYIAGIAGTAVSGTAVKINANGQLGTPPSAARFKDEIKPMDKASEAILALKPVTFRYKKEIDPDGVAQFGLVAEDVAKVNPDLVVREADGKVYTVRYDAVNAMLLNEFLKAHRQIQAQKKQIETMAQQLKEQAAQIQKVSAQVQVSLPREASQLVASRP